ncbi:MAG: hypothetical protein HY203_06605 [Nitrospirae bacterium]|nr:hypothetical protein [Nitrospirota bacterium]
MVNAFPVIFNRGTFFSQEHVDNDDDNDDDAENEEDDEEKEFEDENEDEDDEEDDLIPRLKGHQTPWPA